MTEVVGVRFKNAGKVYYFDPEGKKIEAGMNVIVETARGLEMGEAAAANTMVADNLVVQPLKKVVRIATPADEKTLEKNKQKEEEALRVCNEKIAKHDLDMKLINAEYTFDGSKILFYFTSDGRVDFRELVKELASVFKTRIELRQIGVRDEAKMLGGLGICGRHLCCATFLGDFEPVSIKMAKEQNLSLNPTKISGTCGRLMCCLKYEQDTYEALLKVTPRVGALVDTPMGQGTVVEANVLRGMVKVRLQKDEDNVYKVFTVEETKVLKNTTHKAERKEPKESDS